MAGPRAERGNQQRGIAIAVAAHVLIIGLLSVQWTAGERRFDNPPMEVDLIAETAETSTAPVISDTPPAARLGEEDAVDIAAPEPMPVPPEPEPIVRPTPAPTPKQVVRPAPSPPKKLPPAVRKSPPKAAPKAPPAKKTPTRPTGRLDGITDGLSKDAPKATPKKGAPAAATAAEVKRSIDVSIKAAVAPRWNRCQVSGFDADQLKTVVKFRLTQSGALAGFTSVTTTGENDSNKNLVQRHQECAKRAVELAAPFDLPEENYSFWQNYTLDFIKR
jgi:outer membrane biosynthesis protein TonB